MKRLSKGDAVKFEFSSSEEIEDILKLHKVNFEKLAGSNNRNSNWFNHPKRKPLYQILPALAFAMWNEEFRFDNGYEEDDVKSICNRIFKIFFRRKVQAFEMIKINKEFKRLHKQTLSKYKVVRNSVRDVEPDKFKAFAEFIKLYGCNIIVDKGKGFTTEIEEWTVQNDLSEVSVFITKETELNFSGNKMRVKYWDWLYGQVSNVVKEEITDIIISDKSVEMIFDNSFLYLEFRVSF